MPALTLIPRIPAFLGGALKAALALGILAAPGLATREAAAQQLTNVKITVDYRLYGANAPLWFAQSSGLFREAGINAVVDGSSGSGEAINRVASGAYDVAYADIGTLAEFWVRNPGPAPKLVMVVLDRSAQSVVSLKKKNITALKDLEGRVLGTGQADASSRMFPAILKINNVPMDKIDIKPVEQRLRDAMLIRGDVDAVVGFDSAILFNLATQNITVDDTNVLYFADNGFNFYGNGLLVSKALIEKDPELVKRLTEAVAKAWIASIKDPKETIAALAARDPVTDEAIEVKRLEWIINKNVVTPATRANGFGYMDKKKMEDGLQILAEGFGMAKVPAIADLYDDRFLPPIAVRSIPAK